MPIDSDNKLRDLLQPQDALAGLITLLGIAIAIFLPDSIVKLIGASIGVLGGVALYMTLKGRMHDRVQIRRKKTTLPPPSFKTRVTTDPDNSATRIRFDDFQETFHFDDDEPRTRNRPTPEHAPPGSIVRFDDFAAGPYAEVDDYGDDQQSEGINFPTDPVRTPEPRLDHSAETWQDAENDQGEGFRIVPSGRETKPATPVTPVTPSTQEGRVEEEKSSEVSSETVKPPVQGGSQSGEESRKSEGGRRKKRGGKKNRSGREAVAEGESESAEVATPDPGLYRKDSEPVKHHESVQDSDDSDSEPADSRRAVRRQIQSVLSELTPDLEPKGGGEPRADFVRLVNQILKAIARSIDGRSIIFFWMNLERGHFIPEACVTRGEVNIRLGERIPLANDLVSQIAREGVPEIVTNISPAAENELAPYYTASTGTGSFVGVPVFFRQEVVGVLAADSAEENGFDEGSVATLAEYTLLISQLIRDYAEKFDLYLMRRSVEAFEELNESLTGAGLRPAEIARFLVEQVYDLFETDYAAAVLYDKLEGCWCVAAASANSSEMVDHLRRLEPDMQGSVTGDSARKASEIYIESVDNRKLIGSEESLPRGGSFLAVPLMASAKCYGSLILGNRRSNAWVKRDIDLLRDLSRYVAMAIEVVNTNEALAEQLVYDEQTGLYNAEFFLGGFDREIDRARDFKTPLSLALVRVETPQGIASERRAELSHLSVSEIGTILARKIRPYDLIGRFDDQTFGVALIGKSDQEAYLWAERFRKEIAGHIIPFDSRTYSVTISAGVCNATSSSDKSKVIEGAQRALEKASRDGGNGVVIY